ncbi:MAG TPA: CPBP family intramembrane glutamic endopeptidase [Acidimicrobiia bacterium]
MTLVSTIGPLAAYAAAFQTIVYFLLPRHLRTRWAPLVTGSVGAGVVVLAGSIFGFGRIGLGSVEPGVVIFWAVVTAAIVSVVGLTMLAMPKLRTALADPRLASLSARESFVQIFVRIPVMTALIEEAVFRGVLHSALMALYPEPTAIWLGAGLFGVWHIGPGLDQAESSDAGTLAGWIHTIVTVVATTVAGAALVWLRLETGSIWAGVAVHAALNMTMALFARRAGRSITAIS